MVSQRNESDELTARGLDRRGAFSDRQGVDFDSRGSFSSSGVSSNTQGCWHGRLYLRTKTLFITSQLFQTGHRSELDRFGQHGLVPSPREGMGQVCSGLPRGVPALVEVGHVDG